MKNTSSDSRVKTTPAIIKNFNSNLKKAILACTSVSAILIASSEVGYAQALTEKERLELATAQTSEQEAEIAADGSIQLNQIVISATGFEQNITDAPASISVISGEDLENVSYHDLTDALKGVPGVAVTGAAAEKDIFIRGLPGSYTLLLVDGKRQSTRDARTNGNSGFEQSFLPPANAIERIEVIRGPMSSLYGSDAMGGVINVITKKVSDVWSGSVSVDGTIQQHSRYGNALQGSYYLTGPIVHDVIGLQVWGRGLIRKEDQVYSGMPKQKDLDIAGRFTITPNEDHDIQLEVGTTRIRRDARLDMTVDPAGANSPADNYNKNDRDHWSISHTGRWGSTTSDFSLLQEWSQRTNYSWDETVSRYVKNMRAPKVRNTVLDGKFTTPFELLGEHTLVTGGQYVDTRLTDQNPGKIPAGGEPVNEKFGINQWALFAEDEWWITPDFALTGGLRFDKHEHYGNHLSPRAYAVWHATDSLTLKGGISTGFKAPDIRSIAPGYYYTTQKGAGVIISNPDLKPEESTSYEASALWDAQNGIRLGATYFYTDFKNKIESYNTGETIVVDQYGGNSKTYNKWLYRNIDNAVMQGVELTADWEATDTITLRGNYTYTHSRQKTGKFSGLPLARTPEHMASIRADWTTPVEGLKAWFTGNYHGQETNAGARIGTAGTPIYDEDGKVIANKYKAYATFDIGANYDFNENVTLNAAVYNLFDKRVTVDDNNTSIDGRRLWLGVTSRF